MVDSVADIFERRAKERQIEAVLRGNVSRHVESPGVALVPQLAEQEIEPETPPEPKKPEPKARDLAVAAVGNQVIAHPSLVD